jgi:hypothetical protein
MGGFYHLSHPISLWRTPEEKIEIWYKHNPLALAGAPEKIPDHHFS